MNCFPSRLPHPSRPPPDYSRLASSPLYPTPPAAPAWTLPSGRRPPPTAGSRAPPTPAAQAVPAGTVSPSTSSPAAGKSRPVLGNGGSLRKICATTSKAADIILWRRGRVTFGVIFGATMAWWLFEKSGLSLLTICCDIFLILIVLQFLRVKIAGLLNRQPRQLPELVLSEEMVSNAAASFRVKVNNMLMIAHDITLGKDFRLFFQVVLVLWLLSVIGNFCSSITLAYIGTIALVSIPALYNKYQRPVDRYAGMLHRNISRHYKIVDENVISRLPRRFIRDKED